MVYIKGDPYPSVSEWTMHAKQAQSESGVDMLFW